MDIDRDKPPIEPTTEPDTTSAGEPSGAGESIDAEDRPALQEDDGVDGTPV